MKHRSNSIFMRACGLWLAALACGAPACTPEASPPQSVGARSIFNGVDLTGWDGDARFWRVEDGTLTGETTAANPTERNTFIIYRGADVRDFEVQFEYVIRSDWANSGLQYRSFEVPVADGSGDRGRWIVGGYQADIDQPVQYTGILYGERDRGILALRGQQVEIEPGGKPKVTGSLGDPQALAGHINGKDGWNTYRIEVSGNHAIHEINGVRMAEIVDNDTVVTEPGAKGARTHGILALQLHTGQPMKIQFRSIKLRELAK
ncbi:MAG: DUF1080 domain-containing protein [Phycisphaerae bacterium]|nr:DUF1080 domain-containing protein [Phycisphaerae bacterium]